jgi:hypothetical protein
VEMRRGIKEDTINGGQDIRKEEDIILLLHRVLMTLRMKVKKEDLRLVRAEVDQGNINHLIRITITQNQAQRLILLMHKANLQL